MGLLRKINKKIVKIIFINFGGRKEKTTLLFVYFTYLFVFLLKFRSEELVGCGIKFCFERALSIEIWVKTQRDMLKLWTKKKFFLWQIWQFNHYGWLILLKFYWFLNSNSQEFIVGLFSYKAHFRPQIFSNVYGEKYGKKTDCQK